MVEDVRDAIAGRHQIGRWRVTFVDKPDPAPTDILKSAVTIKVYKVIPMGSDFGDISQNEFAVLKVRTGRHADVSTKGLYCCILCE